MITRLNNIQEILKRKSVLLLGPRRTGKSYFLTHQLKPDRYYNLLEADTFRKISANPEFIRHSLKKTDHMVAIDEIQKLPSLMDEVHAMIESTKTRFILTGSSARKLSKNYTSLMAGRAKRVHFHPLTFEELPKYDLQKRLLYGSLPSVVTSNDPWDELRDYTGLYLQEEIMAEAFVRKIENFSRFLEFAGLNSGQILNFEKLGRDAQVPARTIREYYSLLEDTLLGKNLLPFEKKGKRKAISSSKFYFFDTGILNALVGRKTLHEKGEEFGNLFEHFIFNELESYRDYYSQDCSFSFWRLEKECEVDFIINNEIALEVKSSNHIHKDHLKSLMSFSDDFKVKRKIIVSRDPDKRTIDQIELIPYQDFLTDLWNKKIF
ncbi:MAG: hypothetical protein A2381_09500 [Bdellovibrionales bacterium RIFOXYB1_FULL_37_110]|nr:MAG: hypothetical protein A2417_02995 [Bdellovibrionales bacterium RIFOXYC1_FULL_37_79]OFZ59498.1 MAG: hypothetical protein A2381_09500 [Bdellovibrionales bacterium RIFOXYB1_FULL_37_110]OFZ64217.1 MAG: hypothetical protein A2577_12350 [Bdellovibrionales bacterium RIFOXYD1_FULL_36_51]